MIERLVSLYRYFYPPRKSFDTAKCAGCNMEFNSAGIRMLSPTYKQAFYERGALFCAKCDVCSTINSDGSTTKTNLPAISFVFGEEGI